MFAPVYLDWNASSPLDERVREAMLPYLGVRFGNASSRHEYGRQARDAVSRARAQVGAAVGAHETEVVFTSGGSEANNLFIKGAAAWLKPGVIAIGASEHPCVRMPALALKRAGWRVIELPVTSAGEFDLAAARVLFDAHSPALVSNMLVNNETGVINDVAGLAALARQSGAILHTDAVQALGKIPVRFRELGVQALTISSHKIGGPIGSGALVVDKRVELAPLIDGGGHERGLRSGTENVAAIAGFGVACELLSNEQQQRAAAMQLARDLLEEGLVASGAQIFGAAAKRLPNTSYFAFEHIDGETLVGKLDRAGFAVASGAACSSANPEPSRTLLAMGVAPELARSAVRVSTGPATTLDEVRGFLEALRETVLQLRQMAAVAA